MSTTLRLTPDEYDRMIANGAFEGIERKIELIRGELRQMSPADPVHEDIDFLNRWSTQVTTAEDCVVRVQNSIDLNDSRPEPDVTWLKPGRHASRRPLPGDVLLLIEVANSSLPTDLNETAELYAEFGVAEYWVVDVKAECIHVFSRPDKCQFQSRDTARKSESLSPQCKPSAVLNLSDLFVT